MASAPCGVPGDISLQDTFLKHLEMGLKVSPALSPDAAPTQHLSQGRTGPPHPSPSPSLHWLSHHLDVYTAGWPIFLGHQAFPPEHGLGAAAICQQCSALKHPYNLRI